MKSIHDEGALNKLGTELTAAQQAQVLASYVHRFTGDHKPTWAKGEWKDGKPYPLQFKDDWDWLAHTRFAVTKKGELRQNVNECWSTETWPNGKGEA